MIPGVRSRALARRLRRVESPNITYLSDDFPVFWESAEGCRVRDVDGGSYLDLSAAFAVSSLGHSNPAVYKALVQQAGKMWHGMGDVHPNRVKVEFLEALADCAPGQLNVSILSSTGAEAVESALKTARLATGKPRVLAFSSAYHGLSHATLALTDRLDFRGVFASTCPVPSIITAYPDSYRGPGDEEVLEKVERLLRKHQDIGAVIVEPIQGRGGIRVPRPFFLRELQQLARRHSTVMIVDEIFTGFGRTGRLFGVEHSNVVPDLMCVGKALSNGFPISACIGSKQVMKAWPLSNGEAIHTSTYLGNPLGCAMGLASIREIRRQKLAQRALRLGSWWKDQLQSRLGGHPQVGEIRGRGLMLGIDLVATRRDRKPNPRLASQIVAAGLQKGLILLSGGAYRNVLTLTPPLIISKEELEQSTEVLSKIFHDEYYN